MVTRRRSGNGRLTVDDWVQAGFEILAAEGLTALKLDQLCARLGVTKGSFYWHFEDMEGYRRTLVTSWAQLHDSDRQQVDRMRELPPQQRLAAMMALLVRPRLYKLERAMREWARSDESVEAAVMKADRQMLKATRQAFCDYGFDNDEAERRATTAFATGIGLLHMSVSELKSVFGAELKKQSVSQRNWFVDFLLRP
ncbi:Bacterial regulatory proteins, tetR family [Mycobacterium basiliense]|uniref:Bacterial regulatory proteins, tetR family n=1 Tax=Mycobacterium basiliense TaxID=2094119 RepID=A0A3S4BGV5_9MYCO|nr:TetR/AcrR family transcriptional regulator [Mycobacterium basiliense]VDM89491.1 Bacterial regulatory proteins, tetR family [Mycobacterium basiliense]